MARQQKQTPFESPAPTTPLFSLFERVATYLDANDWHYDTYEEKKYYSAACRIKNATVRVILDVDETETWQRVLVFSFYPIFVPEKRRTAVTEVLNRFNYGMLYGNLEIDLSDGEVRVRTLSESNTSLSDELIDRALCTNLETAGRCFSAIMAVAFGTISPEEALASSSEEEPTNTPPTATVQ